MFGGSVRTMRLEPFTTPPNTPLSASLSVTLTDDARVVRVRDMARIPTTFCQHLDLAAKPAVLPRRRRPAGVTIVRG